MTKLFYCRWRERNQISAKSFTDHFFRHLKSNWPGIIGLHLVVKILRKNATRVTISVICAKIRSKMNKV